MNPCRSRKYLRCPLTRAAASIVVAVATVALHAQPSPDPINGFWHPDGPVNAVLESGNTLYLGGTFGYVGPITGTVASVGESDGAPSGTIQRFTGVVSAWLSDGAGGWFLGGSFVEPITGRSNLVHLLPDRSIDLAFNPRASGPVLALALRGTNLFVGGDFDTIGGSTGITRRNLTAVHPQTGRTNAWNPTANQTVNAIVLGPDLMYAGGLFTAAGRQNRARLAALNLTNGDATSWNPGVSGGSATVRALALDGTRLYVGGIFTTAGGKPRNRAAAISTTLDTVNALDWAPNPSEAVNALAVRDGIVYLGGLFTTVGSATRTNLAAVDGVTGTALPGFDGRVDGPVLAMEVGADSIYIAGDFGLVRGATRHGVARISRSTGEVDGWFPTASVLSPTLSPIVRSVASGAGQVWFSGDFISHGGFPRARLAAIDLTTGRATDWNPGANNTVNCLVAGTDVIYAGGTFTEAGGAPRSKLAALSLTDGAATPFRANVTATAANGVNAILPAGDLLYVGGNFTAIGGSNRTHLAVVGQADGAVKTNFVPNPNGAVRALLLSDTNLYVGGDFATIGGSNRVSIARLSTANGRSTAFTANANSGGEARAFVLWRDRLYVGGDFTTIANQGHRKLVVLDPITGAPLADWAPDVGTVASARVDTIVNSPRALYVGGIFTATGGEFRTALGSIPLTNAFATKWNPGLASGSQIRSLSYSGTRLVAVGDFTTVGGTFHPYVLIYPLVPTFPFGESDANTAGNIVVNAFDGDGLADTIRLEASPTLDPATWTPVVNHAVTGNGITFEDTGTAANEYRFFRVVPVQTP